MSRASESALDALHGLVAGALAGELERAIADSRRPVKKDETGKEIDGPKPINPQLLDKVMKFLKDNGIDAPGRANSAVAGLADQLASLNLDETALEARH